MYGSYYSGYWNGYYAGIYNNYNGGSRTNYGPRHSTNYNYNSGIRSANNRTIGINGNTNGQRAGFRTAPEASNNVSNNRGVAERNTNADRPVNADRNATIERPARQQFSRDENMRANESREPAQMPEGRRVMDQPARSERPAFESGQQPVRQQRYQAQPQQRYEAPQRQQQRHEAPQQRYEQPRSEQRSQPSFQSPRSESPRMSSPSSAPRGGGGFGGRR
jgi:hypothetical protein